MKKTLTALLSVFAVATLCITPAFAEDGGADKKPQRHWAEVASEKQFAKIETSVTGINAEQKTKILAALKERNISIGKAMQLEKEGGEANEVQAQKKATWQSFQESMKSILSEEQLEQFNTSVKKNAGKEKAASE